MRLRPRWLDEADESLARKVALLPLDLAGIGYGLGAALHRAVYERGLRERTQLGCRVISVGSLVVGGAGKTPVAAWLARALHERGHRVVIASRGYGRKSKEPVEVVSDGRFIGSVAETAGDEPMWLAAHAPGVPVLVGPRRDRVGRRAVSAFGAQILVLDDGFQHHRLARDVDLLTLDGRAGFGNRSVLPRGPLREFPSALSRASAIGVLDGPLSKRDGDLLARHAPGTRTFSVTREPTWLRALAGGPREAAGCLDGSEVGMLCAIARPRSFRTTLESLGARVVAERTFADHHFFRPRDLRGLADEAPHWITTEKDAGKLLPRWTSARVSVLGIECRVDDAGDLLDWIEDRLRPKPSGRDTALRETG